MSLQLKLFGGLSLVDAANNTARVTRRHRLAVLAVLATAERPVPRERLRALIWPDSSDENARNALDQVLYGLRHDVALGDLVIGVADLSLNRSHLTCDLWTFREALTSGNRREAIAAYAGPFLDGIQLPNADAFDRWCDEERRALARVAIDTLEGLAVDAESRGDVRDAVHWWRRVALSDPLSSRNALSVMRALVAAGDRAAAVQHARVHAGMVRAELDVEADAAVLTYAEELRAQTPVVSVASSSSSAIPMALATIAANSHETPQAQRTVAANPAPLSAPGALPIRRPLLVVAGVVAVAILILLRRAPASRSPTDAIATRGIAVLPFRGTSDVGGQYLRDAVPVLLGAALDGVGPYRSVDGNAVARAASGPGASALPGPADGSRIARAVGAGTFVLGEAATASGRVQLAATLYDASTSRALARATAAGSADSLFAVVDRLAASLAANVTDESDRSLVQVAQRTTTSLPAFKRFLEGEAAFRAGRIAPAVDAFRSAVTLDPTFALAHYRLATALGWRSQYAAATQALHDGARYAERLPPRARELYALTLLRLQAHDGASADAVQIARSAVARRPDDAPFLLELGEILIHSNALHGRSVLEAREPLRRAVQLDQAASWEALFHLVQLSALYEPATATDSLARQFLAVADAPDLALIVRALQVVSTRDQRAMRMLCDTLAARPGVPLGFAAGMAIGAALVHDDSAMARLIVGSLTRADRTPVVQGAGWMQGAILEAALGRWERVGDDLDEAARVGAANVQPLRERLFALPFAGGPVARREEARAVRAKRGASPNGAAGWIRATVLAERGDTSAALALTDSLAREAVPLEEQRWLRAELLWARDRRIEALDWYGAATEGPLGAIFMEPARRHRIDGGQRGTP